MEEVLGGLQPWVVRTRIIAHFLWALGCIARWVLPVPITWEFFTNWSFAIHTFFSLWYVTGFFSKRARRVVRWIYYPCHYNAWFVFLGVNLVFAKVPSIRGDDAIGHQYLHVAPALFFTVYNAHSPPSVMFDRSVAKWKKLLLVVFGLLPAATWRVFYIPREVYFVDYPLYIWFIVAIFSVGWTLWWSVVLSTGSRNYGFYRDLLASESNHRLKQMDPEYCCSSLNLLPNTSQEPGGTPLVGVGPGEQRGFDTEMGPLNDPPSDNPYAHSMESVPTPTPIITIDD